MSLARTLVIPLLALTILGCSASTDSQSGVAVTPPELDGIQAIVYATQGGDTATLERYLNEFPEVLTVQDNTGNTLLHIAGAYNRMNVVELLLAKGADPTVQNYDGQNCFEYADDENADPELLALLRP
jgi:ankyrin repeat protein